MMEQSIGAEMETSKLNEEAVRKLSEAKKEPEWLLQTRLEALKQFEILQMPTFSYGLHVMAPLNINLEELQPIETITHNKSSAVQDVIIEDLSTAASKYETILRPLMANSEFRHKLDAFHTAFWNNGIFVYAPKRKAKEVAAQVTLLQQRADIAAIVVVAEENANIAVTELLAAATTTDGKAYRFEGVGIAAAAGASVKFMTLQKLGSNVTSIIVRRAVAETAATVDWIDVGIGGGVTKQETITALNGDGATSTTTGAFFGDGTQQLDITAKEIHNARNTTSNIRIKGALQGRAKAIVQSFTKISKNAANSAGHQKSNVLLLSDTARASPIPKLEIDNYDVKASHEASVGQLDSEKLFYMMSRGIEGKDAMRLVVEGFFEPLLKQISSEEMAEELRQAIAERLVKNETVAAKAVV